MNVDKADFLSPVTSQNFLSGGDGVQTQLLCRAARRQPRRWPCSCLQIGVFSGGGKAPPARVPWKLRRRRDGVFLLEIRLKPSPTGNCYFSYLGKYLRLSPL